MDEEMEEAPMVFVCMEIDLDYEFDAPRCFDLGREESPEEAQAAELWFESAVSYPPSPLVAKINTGRDFQADRIDTISIFKNLECPKTVASHIGVAAPGFSGVHDSNNGVYPSSTLKNEDIVKNKSTVMKPFLRKSTLMKPTVSQLAKQDQSLQRKSSRRFLKHLEDKTEKGFEEKNDCTHQAAKRQRLERGHFYKVVDVKQQVDLFHKAPGKKNVFPDLSTHVPRMRITIPREPELQTARRALHIRAQPRSGDSAMLLQGAASTSTFKARPLNRRILEGPSLPLPQRSTPKLPTFSEFNLKTHERAILHSTTLPPSMSTDICVHTIQRKTKISPRLQCQSSIPHMLQKGDNRTEQGKDALLKFKTHPLHNVDPISSSKGNMLFRSKREPTQPEESKFSTAKKSQSTPLTELFIKLSLTSGPKTANARPRFPQSSALCIKDSKENTTTSTMRHSQRKSHVNKKSSELPRISCHS